MILKKVIAHRGIPEFSHENTISSFEKAISFGADIIEFDIRRTADGMLIAFHDPFIMNLDKAILIKDLTFDNLQKIANSQHFIVPSVKEIFKTFANKTGFDIEFKEEECEEETLAIAAGFKCQDFCIVTSFIESIIQKVQVRWPHLPAGLLIGEADNLQKRNLSTYSMLCPSKDVFLANRDFFAGWKRSGSNIAVWTVDDASHLNLLLKDSLINEVITNRCDRALKLQCQILHDF